MAFLEEEGNPEVLAKEVFLPRKGRIPKDISEGSFKFPNGVTIDPLRKI